MYCDVVELSGNEESVRSWNGFYDWLTQSGLSRKAVLEGMSRGAVYVINWVAENPDKVSCVYVDNPVLDLKSWPCGLGRVPASRAEFDLFREDFHLTSQEEVERFTGSPIDKVDQIVQGHYPILILCADADEVVPPEENTIPFEKKVIQLNGRIRVFHKAEFKHHPHSLPDPTPEYVRWACCITEKPDSPDNN